MQSGVVLPMACKKRFTVEIPRKLHASSTPWYAHPHYAFCESDAMQIKNG